MGREHLAQFVLVVVVHIHSEQKSYSVHSVQHVRSSAERVHSRQTLLSSQDLAQGVGDLAGLNRSKRKGPVCLVQKERLVRTTVFVSGLCCPDLAKLQKWVVVHAWCEGLRQEGHHDPKHRLAAEQTAKRSAIHQTINEKGHKEAGEREREKREGGGGG